MRVHLCGVRGSTPAPGAEFLRYGGHTSCVAIAHDGDSHPSLILDAGTGIRGVTALLGGAPFVGAILLTHLHWDHVQGLPFFKPVLRPGSRFDVHAPPPGEGTLVEAFDEFMAPPYFPVRVADLPGDLHFHAVADETFAIGDVAVTARSVPHIGPTNGYRVERDGVSVVYISDHQQPLDGTMSVPDAVLELCDHADLVIHDAQYTPGEFVEKAHWGHCTIEYAVQVAAQSGARKLALFHHDPEHDDAMLDHLAHEADVLGRQLGVGEVLAAAEGCKLSLDAVHS